MATKSSHAHQIANIPALRPVPHRSAIGAAPASVDRSAHPFAPVREQEIRTRAYYLYEERVRAGSHGDALSDWLRAESEVESAADHAIQSIIDGGARGRIGTGGSL
ncbi:MAG: DUF2934 domain-containing protein [Phycisphaeraceae bacterium]|nr:DUF2934 domain-containing protein [Phycisphaeraceae bacterium]